MKPKNLVAKDLRTPKYRMRVVESKVKYNRKDKHKLLTFPLKQCNVGLLAGEY